MTARLINPEALHRPFGYTHVVEVEAVAVIAEDRGPDR